jgi:hypothetical protein
MRIGSVAADVSEIDEAYRLPIKAGYSRTCEFNEIDEA